MANYIQDKSGNAVLDQVCRKSKHLKPRRQARNVVHDAFSVFEPVQGRAMAFLRTAVLIAIVAIIGISDMGERSSVDGRGLRQKNAFEKCRADPDPRYRRQQILEQLAEILKKSIPKDKNYYPLLQ